MRNKTSARSRRSPLHLERLKLKYDSHPLTCNFAPAFVRTHKMQKLMIKQLLLTNMSRVLMKCC